jgi:hypothetical protein
MQQMACPINLQSSFDSSLDWASPPEYARTIFIGIIKPRRRQERKVEMNSKMQPLRPAKVSFGACLRCCFPARGRRLIPTIAVPQNAEDGDDDEQFEQGEGGSDLTCPMKPPEARHAGTKDRV